MPDTPSAPPASEPTSPAAALVKSKDGLDQAIEGLSLEIQRLLARPKTLTTFETVQQVASVGHQVLLLRALLRDMSVDELAEDALPEDIANLFQGGANVQYGGFVGACYPGGGGGLANRVGRRIQARNPRRRMNAGAHVGGAIIGNNQGDVYHHPYGYGARGAPFDADEGDLDDTEPPDPQDAYAVVGKLQVLLRELKGERAEMMRVHGDEHPELAELNARITQFKKRLDEHMDQILQDVTPRSKSGRPAAARGGLRCTQCDQTQNQFWRHEDGTPMPCDICGAPMTEATPADEKNEAAEPVREDTA